MNYAAELFDNFQYLYNVTGFMIISFIVLYALKIR